MSWQDDFTHYATGWAFHIALSHDQATCLAAIGAGGDAYLKWRSRSGRSTFVPTVKSIERRGLTEHNPAAKVVGLNTPGITLKWIYRLTPAGQSTLALLQIAGVVDAVEAVPALEAAQ